MVDDRSDGLVPDLADWLHRCRPLRRCRRRCRRARIVGGAVRDLLLGGAPEDLDLVIEGDAVEAARRLGRRSAAR
jgi:tRNA nucleotidyltransferase/poly(A) polymerase